MTGCKQMVVLLGATGYVGAAFQRHLQTQGIPCKALTRDMVNLCDKSAVAALFHALHPTFVINAAGFIGRPNVDATEHDKIRCLMSNTTLPAVLAEVCADQKIPWGHVSTGCIFNGTRPDGRPFTEEDKPNFSFRQNNCGFYCGTKALAEELLVEAPGCYIWRLRIPFNEIDNPRNYLSKVMRYAKLIDVRNSISQLDEFVRASLLCHTKEVPFGIYNIVNPGSITTREVAAKIQQHNLVKKEFVFFRDEAEFMHEAATVPRANCEMSCEKLLKTGIPLTPLHDAIDWALSHWKA